MYAEEPPRSVSRAAISPPVQDSATATVRPFSSSITWSSTVEPSTENSVSPCCSRIAASKEA